MADRPGIWPTDTGEAKNKSSAKIIITAQALVTKKKKIDNFD